MYNPKHFEQSNPGSLKEFISDYPLAVLVSSTLSGLEGNHLPLYLVEEGENLLLRGHVARANSLWEEVEENAPVLAIFQGPHAYISPNWYPTKREDGKAVPTWNYTAVYVNGNISFIMGDSWKRDVVSCLTNKLEQKEGSSWKVSDAPEEYLDKQLKAIVGIEISVNSLKGKWKLSQNQPANNKKGVIKALSESEQVGAKATMAIMNKINKD